MRRNLFILFRLLVCLAAWRAGMPAACAITAASLQQELARGAKLTLIDVRSLAMFAREHIPGAMNVPAALCPLKQLPALGRVVIYDHGLGRDATDEAAAALSRKPGITVEVLEGGFASWQSAHGMTTRKPGSVSGSLNYISYAELQRAKSAEILLLDLRKQTSTVREPARDRIAQAPTDLAREFPGLKRAGIPFDPVKTAAAGSGAPPLLVLIDDGDGTSEAFARILHANGMRRCVILAGGELILARHGRAGLGRLNGAFHPANLNPAPGPASR
jgi:rhodanese-related sulfurtransferase